MSYNYLPLDRKPIKFQQVKNLLQYDQQVSITFDAHERILQCREIIQSNQLNTHLTQAFTDGVSNATTVPLPVLKLILMLKLKYVSCGTSGISIETVKRIMEMYNHGVFPFTATPSATSTPFVAEALQKKGSVFYENQVKPAEEVFNLLKWPAQQPDAFEMAALTWGNQVALAYALYALQQAGQLLKAADTIAMLSETGHVNPFSTGWYAAGSRYHQKATKLLAYASENALPGQQTALPTLQLHVATEEALKHAVERIMFEVNQWSTGNVFDLQSQKLMHLQPSASQVIGVMNYLQSALLNIAGLSFDRLTVLQMQTPKTSGATEAFANAARLLSASQHLFIRSVSVHDLPQSIMPLINGLKLLENLSQVLATEWWLLTTSDRLANNHFVQQYKDANAQADWQSGVTSAARFVSSYSF